MNGSIVRRTARIAAGEGTNQITINDGVIREDLKVTAGAGDDVIQLLPAAVIRGKTKIDLGGGTNSGP